MSEIVRILLPIALNPHALEISPAAILDDEQFAAHQAEFLRTLFGYASFLREHARETPVADAFLSTFVNLLETLQTNAPEEARTCVDQLQQIIRILFPDAASIAPPSVDGSTDITPA